MRSCGIGGWIAGLASAALAGAFVTTLAVGAGPAAAARPLLPGTPSPDPYGRGAAPSASAREAAARPVAPAGLPSSETDAARGSSTRGDARGKTAPSPAQTLAEEAGRERAAGRGENAVVLYQRALALDPGLRNPRLDLGWTLYRLGRFTEAAGVFLESTRREPARAGAWTGLGYARLQSGDYPGAETALATARRLAPRDPEPLKATALVYIRTHRASEAVPLLRQALAAVPSDAEAAAALGQALATTRAGEGLVADRRLRPVGLDTPEQVRTPFRAGVRYFEVRRDGAWVPLLVKGVNLGLALPGKFPSEFPLDAGIYRDWLGKIRAMNANVVRAYTLLPPVFYRTLAEENRAHPGTPLYLVQGVWVELPPDDRFDDPDWNRQYAEEIRRVIDAVHGNLDVAPRPGHASGRFDADASPWMLGMILGREWEPYAVRAFDEAPGSSAPRAFSGSYVRLASGTRMEAWIASILETAAAHEARAYGESRPLAFTNWPTLDPLTHPTEATRAEEDRILERMGRPRGDFEGVVYDNDGPSLDAQRMAATPALPAGLFASYHVYPYFPDFMILDPGYRAFRNRQGAPDAYAGYLRDLVRHHAGHPVLIAEVGVPTSRGVAHSQPQGYDHGGHDERAQAAIDVRLVRTIQETGCAGAIVFSWMDEWFKRNWLVSDLESPADRNPLWLNVMDPEQNFGILAAEPGPATGGIVLDGRTEDWSGIAPVYAPLRDRAQRDGRVRALYATSDEAYLYLRLDVDPGQGLQAGDRDRGLHPDRGAPGAGNGDDATYWIGIDTYDHGLGARALPGLAACPPSPSGLEFLLRLDTHDPRLLVAAPYDIGSHRNSGPYASAAEGETPTAFVSMKVEIRMERFGRDGTTYPAEMHDLSPLRRGTTDLRAKDFDSLADLFEDRTRGIFEIRIPWNLLNVTDPSSHRVVAQTGHHLPPLDTTESDGFAFFVAATPPQRGVSPEAASCEDVRPRRGEDPGLYRWKGWETPRYHLRLKAVYGALRSAFEDLGPLRRPEETPPPRE